MLVEIDGCIFDKRQLKKSHGFEHLDSVGKEAFVNHLHLNGRNKEQDAQNLINGWTRDMKSKWPGKKFKVYQQIEPHEITLRFHLVREDEPDWCDSGIEIIEVRTYPAGWRWRREIRGFSYRLLVRGLSRAAPHPEMLSTSPSKISLNDKRKIK